MKMQERISFIVLLCMILLFSSTSIIKAQVKNDWSKVYANKYFCSDLDCKKCVIIYARRDTMIEVWIDGKKDTADYSEGKSVEEYESWDNGVMLSLELYDDNSLGVYSRTFLGIESDYQVEPNIQPVIFDRCTFYECSYYRNVDNFNNLRTCNLLKLNTTAYNLIQIGDEQCYDCAISILEKITDADSKLADPILNLADAYWEKDDMVKAIENYHKYIELMTNKGWENKIPKRVYERVNTEN